MDATIGPKISKFNVELLACLDCGFDCRLEQCTVFRMNELFKVLERATKCAGLGRGAAQAVRPLKFACIRSNPKRPWFRPRARGVGALHYLAKQTQCFCVPLYLHGQARPLDITISSLNGYATAENPSYCVFVSGFSGRVFVRIIFGGGINVGAPANAFLRKLQNTIVFKLLVFKNVYF